MSIKIAISGPAGSGKSTVIKEVAEALGAEIADIGQVFRAVAEEKGMDISEYDKYLEQHPDEDRKMDEKFRDLVMGADGDMVVSWRMGWHFVPDIISIWLDVSPDEGAQRVFADKKRSFETLAEAKRVNIERMARKKAQLERVYGVDFTDESHYTKVVETTGKLVGEVVAEILEFLRN